MATPSSYVSQAEGMTAGFHSALDAFKKRICCAPEVEQQESLAKHSVALLKEPLEALEAALEKLG